MQIAFRALEREFMSKTGNKLLITCTYRSPEEQQALFNKGRFGDTNPIVTMLDGIEKKSNHNFLPSRAIDVAVLIGDKVSWSSSYYWPLVELAPNHGLVSGGSWFKWKDFPHLELA